LTTNKAFQSKENSGLLLIQFKVTSQGITLTDLNKKKFLRQHFPTASVSYCAIEEKHTWPNKIEKINKPRYVHDS
jgi:tensin